MFEFLETFWKDPTKEKVAGYLAGKDDDTTPSAPIRAREQYFSLTLESMHIVLAREGLKKFFGVVSGQVGFELDRGPETITAIISPEALRGVERKDLGKIIVQTIPICEKIPFIGESIELRIALMSMEAQDLLSGVVDILSSVASAAGVGYVEQAKAFLAPIQKGVELLTKQGGTEIGVYKSVENPRTGYYCVASAPLSRLDLSRCRLSPTWQLIDQDGKVVTDVPYFVIRVSAHDRKENFAKIPSIRDAFARLRDHAIAGDQANAQAAFEVYTRLVSWSPDLLEHDKEPMIEFARTHLNRTFPAVRTSSLASFAKTVRKFPELETLRLDRP